jgi:hypothetical protein
VDAEEAELAQDKAQAEGGEDGHGKNEDKRWKNRDTNTTGAAP